MEESPVLFYIGSFGVSSIIITMVVITILLVLLGYVISRRVSIVPGKLQNAMEMLLGSLQGLVSDMMGEKLGKRYFPLMATLFIFIIVCNYSGLLPFAGEVPGFAAPTSSLSVTAGLAIIVFIATHYFGLKEHKFSYFKHFFKPIVFLFPIFLLDEFIRPVTLSLRLYGNIVGEETLIGKAFEAFPLILPLLPQMFALFMGFLQAFIFMLLTCVYIGGAAGEEEL